MEPVGTSADVSPLSEDTDILTVINDDDEVFENIYDVPFVTVNQVGDEIHAEIILSGVREIDHDRISAATSVARGRGYRSYARFFGDLYEDTKAVTMLFSQDSTKGIIWALENEVGSAWSL